MKWSRHFGEIMTIAGAALLASCESATVPDRIRDEPFNFTEIRELAKGIGSLSPSADAVRINQLRDKTPRVSDLYGQALARFEGIYGEGIGPAKGQPDYQECKRAFHGVSAVIGAPAFDAQQADLSPLWSALEKCHDAAKRWSGPTEMATFGHDLKSMTQGSMLVASYAAALLDSGEGVKLYKKFEAIEVQDNGAI
tara:strand:+ start:119628 stop:120215 length:588 start_codon:yes stop_codon:yes gene_type:complete